MSANSPAAVRSSVRKLSDIARKLYADGSPTQWYRPYICPFEELLPLVPEGSSILDVGCGNGLFLGLLAVDGRISSGIGFDNSKLAIAGANRMCRNLSVFGTMASLTFRHLDATEPWPDGQFDVVSIIDVMHHVPHKAQRTILEIAISRVRPSGLIIYKDMVCRPAWRAWANRMHDLLMARQWIHYLPIEHLERQARELGLRLVSAQQFNKYCYGHELRVFTRD